MLAGLMDIQIAVLCDAATVKGGKLNVQGTFDTIFSPQFPAVHARCAIALRLTFKKVEEGKHKLRLLFLDEDGKAVMPPVELAVEVAVPDETLFVSRDFVVNVENVKFEREGVYTIDLALNARHEASIPLLVKKMPQGAKPQND